MFHKTPALLQWYFHSYLWKMPGDRKVIYLTFDDGPIPGVTDFVLEQLAAFEARATFFCVGENIQKHPDVFRRALDAGHEVGNHTFNHLTGWKTGDEEYLANTALCETEIRKHRGEKTRLMRPPHGRIKKSQGRALREQGYEIVMWEVLTKDYDRELSPEKCFEKACRYTRPGSIVLFHDSLKAEKNLRYALPRFLAYFSKAGYRFESLSNL